MDFAVEMYKNDPEFFIANKDIDVNKVLLNLIDLYQKEILQL
jgi:hypothetical protein